MSAQDLGKLIQALQEQHKEQLQQQKEDAQRQLQQQKEQVAIMQQQSKEQMALMQQQLQLLQGQIAALTSGSGASTATAASAAAIPSFSSFDSSAELWTDYWSRFKTFVGANSVPAAKQAQVFLTNQRPEIYKMISNLASQTSPPRDINQLTLEEISAFMKDQFDPKRFVVRERFKFWSDTKRKPGETIQELAARVRQKAATCNFASITDAQDEAMRTNFICSVNNEAVLKALFKIPDDELTFARSPLKSRRLPNVPRRPSTELRRLSTRSSSPRPGKPARVTRSNSNVRRDAADVGTRAMTATNAGPRTPTATPVARQDTYRGSATLHGGQLLRARLLLGRPQGSPRFKCIQSGFYNHYSYL
jgi:hypothetical protein